MAIDRTTKRWIRNASDEHAAAQGMRMNLDRAEAVLEFGRNCFVLYEGECAGQFLDPKPHQIDLVTRLFGWERWSEHYQRWVRRFRKASIWWPKKNMKSPTLAWFGLYLLVADGEQGQKVFSAAHDGKQALISHTHAEKAIKKSPLLDQECTINKATHQITHEASGSTYSILSADNKHGQEGINGSVLIDETHVVSLELARIIEDAGASRPEPLQAEFSTVGNDPETYGRKQYEYGKAVAAGEIIDPYFYFECYEAPQTLTDVELDKDPVKYGKAANPAWGHTINAEEFLQSYERAKKRGYTDLMAWKQRRLNIWAAGANPWLDRDKWTACKRRFCEADLIGLFCWMGLDCSKTYDMSAVVLNFQDPDNEGHHLQLPWFWIPEQTARDNEHKASFFEWEQAGELTIIPGEVIQQSYIKETVRELSQRFRIMACYYDPLWTEDLTQFFELELGIERFKFPQTTANFTGPIEDYERLIVEGKLHHNGNRVLSWQAGNAKLATDSKGRKLLVKPKKNDVRKIDGMVAGVMAHAAALAGAGNVQSTYYETNEVEYW